jgi:hypothetical protein
MFDAFLLQHASLEGIPFQPFEIETDYIHYVDGKPRLDGVRSFLGSKGVELPEGGRMIRQPLKQSTSWVSASTRNF